VQWKVGCKCRITQFALWSVIAHSTRNLIYASRAAFLSVEVRCVCVSLARTLSHRLYRKEIRLKNKIRCQVILNNLKCFVRRSTTSHIRVDMLLLVILMAK
jgi:hypothetical protein